MTETQGFPKQTIRNWNENGRLYLWGGVISSIISLVVIPLFGLLAVFCGYKLYDTEKRIVSSVLIAGSGGLGFLNWVIYLATL